MSRNSFEDEHVSEASSIVILAHNKEIVKKIGMLWSTSILRNMIMSTGEYRVVTDKQVET